MQRTRKHTTLLPRCSDCAPGRLGVCRRCETPALDALDEAKTHRRFGPGATITRAGNPVEHVGTVISGLAVMSILRENGSRQIVGLLHPGDFFGRPDRSVAPFDIEALTGVELCAFKPSVFNGFLRDRPELHDRFLEMALDELDVARHWMVILGRKSAREKVASLLLRLFYRHGESDAGAEVALPLSREQIGDVLSLTFETVSRQVSSLKRDGVVTFPDPHHYTVPDPGALMDAAGDDADGAVLA